MSSFAHPRRWHVRQRALRSFGNPHGVPCDRRVAGPIHPDILHHCMRNDLMTLTAQRRRESPHNFLTIDEHLTSVSLGYHGRAPIRARNAQRVLGLTPTEVNRQRWGQPTDGVCPCCNSGRQETVHHRLSRCIDVLRGMPAIRREYRERVLAAVAGAGAQLEDNDGPAPDEASIQRLMDYFGRHLPLTDSGRFDVRAGDRTARALLSGAVPIGLHGRLVAAGLSEEAQQRLLRALTSANRRFHAQMRRAAFLAARARLDDRDDASLSSFG